MGLAAGAFTILLVWLCGGLAPLIGNGTRVPEPTSIPPDAVRIVQANITYNLPGEVFAADLTASVAWQPDLVSLNEVGLRPDTSLAPAGYAAYRKPGGSAQARSTAILWRKDRWTFIRGGRVQLVPAGPRRQDADRSASWVQLRAAGQSPTIERLSIVSAHLMVDPTKYGPRQRLRQDLYRNAMVVLGKLVKRLTLSGPVLVAGDFNSQWSANDPWGPRVMLRDLSGPSRLTSTMDGLGQLETFDSGGTIDYVFFQPAFASALSQLTLELSGSDHKALQADIRFTGGRDPAEARADGDSDSRGAVR